MTGLYKFDFFPKDWFSDTRDLSQQAKGAYIDVLAALYSKGAPLPYSEPDLCRLTGCATVRSLRPLLAELIAKDKLKVIDGRITNNRAMEEIARFEALKAAGSKGGRPPKNQRSTGVQPEYEPNSTGTQPETHGDIEQNQEVDLKPSPSPSPSIKKKEYCYAGKLIRLTAADHQKWRQRYHAIPDLDVELAGLDDWYDRQHPEGDPKRANWWHAVQNALAKRHQRWVLERAAEAPVEDHAAAYRKMGVL